MCIDTCRDRNGGQSRESRQYDQERKASGEERTDDNDLSNDKDGVKVKSSFTMLQSTQSPILGI